MRMYFDTETVDYWKFDKDPTDPSQPHLLQLAAVVEDESGRTVAALSAILQQHLWPYDDNASRTRPRVRVTERVTLVHKLSDRDVDAYGQPPDLVFEKFRRMARMVDLAIGHNVEFDIGVLRRTAAALHVPEVSLPTCYCTMRSSTHIVGLTKPNGGLKYPKLGEAYAFFQKRPLQSAHDALVDVYATRSVYRGIQKFEAAHAG